MCVVTRDAAIEVLTSVTCAPVTRTIRNIRSEVAIGPDEGLTEPCAIACDNLVAIPRALLDPEPVGRLGAENVVALDHALRYALGITW